MVLNDFNSSRVCLISGTLTSHEPPNNGFNGTDSFTYQCTDGQTTSAVAAAVIAVNNWAFANNNAYGMSSNKTLSVDAPTKGFIGLDGFTYQCSDSQSTSRVALATINVVTQEPPPVILSQGLTNNNIAVTWKSAANLIYQLQSCDSLNSTGWVNVRSPMTASGPITTETNVIGNASQQFYRVSLLTP